MKLKHSRLEILQQNNGFSFLKADISDKEEVMQIFSEHQPEYVIHLAAQAGVRYSIENPDSYIQSNVLGFFHILEACRSYPVRHLLYASSSSVYGANQKVPFDEGDFVDHPVSLYAATKKSNELMAYTYGHLFQLPSTGLRFFTVYGPMGRPDMAYFGFTDRYFKDEPVKIFNNGDFDHDLYRDFTYIDDIIDGIMKLIHRPPSGEQPSIIYNIGNNKPEKLMVFIEALEKALSRSLNREVVFRKVYEPMKAGDVPVTYASTDRLERATGFRPVTPIAEGLQRFTDWYVDYYHVV